MDIKGGCFFALKSLNDSQNFDYSTFINSVVVFRPKNFENRLKNGYFMTMGTLKTCKIGLL